MITAVLFDLDGTLLPMDMDEFVKGYFKYLVKKALPYGYEPQKLIDTIWGGIKVMAMNDGHTTNEEVFWEHFVSVYGEDKIKDKEIFDDFYENEFKIAKNFCGYNPKAAQIIEYLKGKNIRNILATNPIFPKVATRQRIEWAGINENDFEFYTTYENSIHAKPNVEYYRDVLRKAGLSAKEVLMVGNDATEDLAAAKLGIRVFLITDCLINADNVDLSEVHKGDFDDLKKYIDSLI